MVLEDVDVARGPPETAVYDIRQPSTDLLQNHEN